MVLERSRCQQALPSMYGRPGQQSWGTGGQNGGAGVGSRTGCSYYRFWEIGPGVQQVPQPVGSVSQLPRLTAALF